MTPEQLRALAAKLQQAHEGHNQSCYYCGELTNDLAADPGQWSIGLCHSDEPGVLKWHHTDCVQQRIQERTAAVAEALEKRDRDWILAMGHALGLDSGYKVPIVPEVAPFKELFDSLKPHSDGVCVPWEPTHKHAEGGIYKVISECKIHTDISEWVDGVVYRNMQGTVFVRPAGEFANRFTALAAAEGKAIEQKLYEDTLGVLGKP